MAKNKVVFFVLLCSGVLALSACGMSSDRDRSQSGEGSSRGSGMSGQAASSSQVSQVQVALKAKGYDPGSTDGVMGAQTQEALRKFQQANGLPATGSVDAQTAKALGISTSGSASSGAGATSSGESSGGSTRSRGSGGD